ncbi:hypothetical protein BP422_16905 [Brevibacillus formosus]|uniref:Uncharacterized protein n=1 Tax=Brevibacillus formosus TaxID=54913 RepID=A0A220MKI3_9BACL|nr:hypothetical protein BP422_16905 [Brevibacillus formosus]
MGADQDKASFLRVKPFLAEKSEDLWGAYRGAMEKVKHAFKRPPLRSIFESLLWTRLRFFHGAVQ